MLSTVQRRLARNLRELGLLLRKRVGARLERAPPAREELVDGEDEAVCCLRLSETRTRRVSIPVRH